MEKLSEVETTDQKPGTGIDRTLIREMLVLTPAERFRMMVQASRNVAAFLARARRL